MSKSESTIVENGKPLKAALTLGNYAARSNRGDFCSIENGVTLVLWWVLANRTRGFLASLRTARKNVNMKNTAAPQMLMNPIEPITVRSILRPSITKKPLLKYFPDTDPLNKPIREQMLTALTRHGSSKPEHAHAGAFAVPAPFNATSWPKSEGQ